VVGKATVMVDPAMVRPRDYKRRPRPLLRTILGDVLRRTRLEQGRTLADVARIARVSMPYLSELERGRKEASSEILAAICDALRIELSDLLAEIRRELAADGNRRLSLFRSRSVGNLPVPAGAPAAGDKPAELPDDLAGPALSQPGADDMQPDAAGPQPGAREPMRDLVGPLPSPAGRLPGMADAQCRLAA
jgi:transcriptional regulator with XRE-family HTH domain